MSDVKQFTLYLTRLELLGSLAAVRAVAESAPPGSPGEPLLSAAEKFEKALHEEIEANLA